MLSDRIKAARKAKGLTQKDVAEALRIDQSTYSGYETGKRQPMPTTISQLAALFGVTGDYLLDIEIEKEKPVQADEPFEEFEGLNAENREKVRSFAAYLLSQQSEP